MFLRARVVPVGLIATAAAMISTAPAQAGVLVPTVTSCPTPALSQPFLPWGDSAQYELVPGGNFEAGAQSWSLSGGAADVAGNESYYVGSPTDSQSLSLPSGSSATSPAMCVGIQNPDLRLFAENTGSSLSTLTVSVNFQTSLGGAATLPIGVISAGSSWQPTLQDPIVANLLALMPGDQTPVSFTFTPSGGGNWQIDDVYVDPWERG
jgi:hypothetical protein